MSIASVEKFMQNIKNLISKFKGEVEEGTIYKNGKICV